MPYAVPASRGGAPRHSAHRAQRGMAHARVHAVTRPDGRVLFYTGDPSAGGTLVVSLTGGKYRDQNGKVYESPGGLGWFLRINEGVMRGFQKAVGARAQSVVWEDGRVCGRVLQAKPNGLVFTGAVDAKGEEYGYLLRRADVGFKIVAGPGRTVDGIMDKTMGMHIEGARKIRGMLEVRDGKITFTTSAACETIDASRADVLRANFLRSLDGSIYRVKIPVQLSPMAVPDSVETEIKITKEKMEMEQVGDELGVFESFNVKTGESMGRGSPELLLGIHEHPDVGPQSPLWLRAAMRYYTWRAPHARALECIDIEPCAPEGEGRAPRAARGPARAPTPRAPSRRARSRSRGAHDARVISSH